MPATMSKSGVKRFFISKKGGSLALVAGAIAIAMLYPRHAERDPLVIDDVSRLNQTRVREIVRPRTEHELKQAILRARELGLKISVSGKRHSQGGHSLYPDSMHLDMTSFNKVIALNESEKTIRVQSGATWKQVQEHLNPHGLAVAVMQSSNIFTIGGSLSANVHGRDPNHGPIIETVGSFRLMDGDGEVINASRTENAELFSLAIGGFGLFGVILDAELRLTDNDVYEKRTVALNYHEYPAYFENYVNGRPEVGIHFGRLSIDPASLLREGYAVTYTKTAERPEEVFHLSEEDHVSRDKFFFGLSRTQDWGKGMRWRSQQNWVDVPGDFEIVSRNNVMRPPIQFLDYDSADDTDVLQEYFVPIARFVEFIDNVRRIVDDQEINLLSVTLRFVPANDEAFLSYANNDSVAVVLYINHERSTDGIQQAERWTQKLIEAANQCDGTYYLVYQQHASPEQLLAAYPRIESFLERKRFYDVDEIIMNRFYEHCLDCAAHATVPGDDE